MKDLRAALSVHDVAVQQIAHTMLSWRNGEVFPGYKNPGLGTFTNCPERTMPVEHNWEGTLWPDIVVADSSRANAPRLVAEVETEETLNERSLDKVWKLAMDVCPNFYLFVPSGAALESADLLLEFRTMTNLPRALYTYSFDPLWRIQLTAV
jgi:hypothetical protein